MLTGVSYFTQSSSWIFENVTAEKTVSKVANINTKSTTTASVFLLFCFSSLFLFSPKRKRLFENVPSEICSHLSEKIPKGVRKAQKWHQQRKKKWKIERVRRRKGGEEEKGIDGTCTLSFYIGYFENNCLTEEVFLAVKFSKIQLDVYHRQLLRRIQKYNSRIQVKHAQWAQAQFSYCKQRMDSCDKKTA